MELVKLIHDLAITGGCIAIAVLPRLIVAFVETKANGQERTGEGI
jgi:hypothetical protein